jgi:Flp pilus assembly protein TadD
VLDGNGDQLAANAIDGPELFPLQDRVADEVMRDLRLRRGAQRTPTPSGLDTAAAQEKYLEAVGLLQRYDQRKGVEKALAILGKLAEEKPNSALVQAALGRADLAMLGLTSDREWARRAIAASDAARAIDPSLPEVDVIQGETLRLTGQPKEAIDAYRRALTARPGDVLALLGLGRAAEAAGDNAAAEVALRRAAELQPSFAVFNQIASHYYDLARYGEAAEMFRRATLSAPDSSWALSNLGGAEAMRCNFPAAIDAFREALAHDPKNPSAASNLGLTQLWSGHPAEAVASLERAANGAPKEFKIWGNLADAYAELPGSAEKASGAYARSIALAREQLQLNPRDAEALSYVATGLAHTGHLADAEAPMREALQLEKNDPALLADAATVAALSRRDGEALDYLRKAVAAGYCPIIVTFRPEFARFHENPDFRSIVTVPQKAAGV